MVHRDAPDAAALAEQPRVDALDRMLRPFEMIAADQHRGVGGEQLDAHVVETQRAARGGRCAIVADVVVERALPAVLELATGNEHHVGIGKPLHIAAKIAAVPRRLHPGDQREDRSGLGGRVGDGG